MIEVKSKEFYIDHLPEGLPIFYQPFYLDSVTAGNWEVSCIVEKDNVLVSMPYPLVRQRYTLIRQPPLTIYLGPYFSEAFRSEISLSQEMEFLEALESSLLTHHYYNQNWHPLSRNWLPFYWKGYHQSSRYSYIIPAQDDMAKVRSAFNENARRNIKKTLDKVHVEESEDVAAFFSIIEKTFERKNNSHPYDFKMFGLLIQNCLKRECGSIFLARDRENNLHAAMFFIWDQRWVYYIAGGIDEQYKRSGAMSLLFDKAIAFAMQSKKSFDFEGSMLKPVEKFFRSFGACQQEYFVVTKATSTLLRIRLALARIYPALAPF